MNKKDTTTPSHPPTDRWLTETEAAVAMGLQKQTMAAWRVRGCGPPFVKLGRSIRYRASTIAAYIEARTCTSTAQARKANTA